ncbi:MAG: tRNA (adenosine(37)-N6)-threonylcarbamoyltransferase complex dimerization subunit type 1 TsaB [Spirochaetales bacterium]|nr:tRNA (adenosine(37)-N6)-threonylcarbamoyltransferase complex dimerization subunit type 1 TsaB [Spirochaetales bacterium]
MNILAIDTSTEILGISIKTREEQILNISLKMGFQHALFLVSWIEQLCEQAELKPSDLDLVVCSIGPGSFTGLRIGLSTAKGIACGADCPVIGISSLDTIVYGHRYYPGVIVPVIDARKNRFYSGIYQEGKRISEYFDISLDDLLEKCMEYKKVLVAGPGAKILMDSVKNDQKKTIFDLDPGYTVTNPFFLLKAGSDVYALNKKGDPDTAGPLYLRKSEAEIHLKKI